MIMDMSDHSHDPEEGTIKEYFKFTLVIIGIFVLAIFLNKAIDLPLMQSFMAMFFLVFAIFKLANLQAFVASFIGYDLVASRIRLYAYAYPFIQLAFVVGYLWYQPWVNYPTIIVSFIGSFGVAKALLRKSNFKCACLGTVIKLPLSTVSLIEDLGMAIMAIILLLNK